MEWAPWKTLLAIGIAGALVIALSPMMLGVAGALESRRQRMTQSNTPPPD
ncbi:hypothetical protein DB30_02828 [Enhygromyxa salina]|uniref:Uncharacterized protein n=1 Tax=Enhygromyxa salina TaxID=215803 RepID=A0A0C2D854_9BACT|nr:hypothetical protein DB30_02828 [Enhygromyxa salina]